MGMEVEIVSSEQIRPSLPTPKHLQLFKLSILDQLILPPYAPIIFFYQHHHDLHTTSSVNLRLDTLRTSLSQTLTQFYPLAGTLKDDLSILCNDVGARFVSSRVNDDLGPFLACPDLAFLNRLLPCSFSATPETVTFVTNIQVNVFDCGGLAIAVCISHKILDGAGIATFLKAWTSAARHGCVTAPNFVAASLFPTNDTLWVRDSVISTFVPLFKQGKFITRVLVFNAWAMNQLKNRAEADQSMVKPPSRVEAVSAFIWKSAMAGWKQQPSFLTHSVDLRRRMDPSLVENSIGNLLWYATATNSDLSSPDMCDLVKCIRDSISKMDGAFVEELMNNKGRRDGMIAESLGAIKEKARDQAPLLFSSWCKMGFYEADFGWGKPVWVSSTGMMEASAFPNLVVLVDTKSGDGIEAWVTMDERDMARVESDHQLLTFESGP